MMTDPSDLPSVVSSGPPYSPQKHLPLNSRIGLTEALQACICDLNGSCMSNNFVYKEFFICVYQDGNEDLVQSYRLQQITSMQIKHGLTKSVFEPITSDYTADGMATATYISPWVSVESSEDSMVMIIRVEQLLGIWYDFEGSTIDINGGVSVRAEGDTTITTQSTEYFTEYFQLTAQLMGQQSQLQDSLVFACTCDLTNTCYDLKLELLDVSITPSIRICIVPQDQNDEGVDIVRITQLTLKKTGPYGFPFDVVSDGYVSPLAAIVEDDSVSGVSIIVATINLLSQHFINPSSITVYGAAEVKLADSELKEVPFGSFGIFLDAVDEPSTRPTTLVSSSVELTLHSCQCDSNYECIAEPSPLYPSDSRVQFCLLARPQPSTFIDNSVSVLLMQNSYSDLIVKDSYAVGTGTAILFKNETLVVIETFLETSRSLTYVGITCVARLLSASFSGDVFSDLRLSLYIEPSNQPSAIPSSSHRPTVDGPTFKPTQSSEPTEDQSIRLVYCPCDNAGVCHGDRLSLTQFERNIRICFKAAPTTAWISSTPFVTTNLTIPSNFTKVELDSDMKGGRIIIELPENLVESSIGSAVNVLGKFSIREGPDRNAISGLSLVYKIQSLASSTYCSSAAPTQLTACACQCDDQNNCVEGVVQTLLSPGKLFL